MDKRDFKSRFLLKDGQLVPLFNLSSLLNSKSSEETLPFLSLFLPDKVDDSNSSYQVFLRFRFDERMQKTDIKASVVTAQEQVTEQATELENETSVSNTLETVNVKLANELLVN